MAKSIRSKRMRKLRAFKRIRYGEKELARLKEMLSRAAAEEKTNLQECDTSNSNTYLVSKEVESEIQEKAVQAIPSKYPSWLSNFKIRKLAKQNKKQERKELKRLKKQKKASKKSKSKKSSFSACCK